MAERAVEIAMNIVIGPEFAVRTCRTDFETPTTGRMKKQWSGPAIDELAIGIQGDVLIGKKTFVRGIFASKEIGPIFIRAERAVRGGFKKEGRIIDKVRHESKVVLGRKIGFGVVAENRFAEDGK